MPTTATRALDAVGAAIAALRRIKDPAERIRAIRAVQDGLGREAEQLRSLLRDTILELREQTPRLTWDEVGALYGVTGARATQLAQPATPKETNP